MHKTAFVLQRFFSHSPLEDQNIDCTAFRPRSDVDKPEDREEGRGGFKLRGSGLVETVRSDWGSCCDTRKVYGLKTSDVSEAICSPKRRRNATPSGQAELAFFVRARPVPEFSEARGGEEFFMWSEPAVQDTFSARVASLFFKTSGGARVVVYFVPSLPPALSLKQKGFSCKAE